MPAGLVAKDLDGLDGRRLRRPRQQVLHVAAEPGQAEQSGLLVEKALDVLDRHALLGEQVENDPRVEVAAAGTHGQAGQRGEAHRGLDAPPTLQRSHVGAIRSEEHTSELQSLMRTSYAAFCLIKKHT